MKIIETGPGEIGFVLWGHCQNLLDDPRIFDAKYVTGKFHTCLITSHYSSTEDIPAIWQFRKWFSLFKNRTLGRKRGQWVSYFQYYFFRFTEKDG